MSSLSLLIVSAGALLLVGGVIVLLRAWFADRSRGRRRCPVCWYALDSIAPAPAHGAPAGAEPVSPPRITCPECGTANPLTRLHRTRRHRRRAALGLLVALLGVGVSTAEIARTTPITSAPSTVLIIATSGPVARRIPLATLQAAYVELADRFQNRRLAAWQERHIFNRELGQMLDLPPAWIAGVPFPARVAPVMSISQGLWQRRGWTIRLRVLPDPCPHETAAPQWAVWSDNEFGIDSRERLVATTTLPPDAHAMRIAVEVRNEKDEPVWSGLVPRSIPLRATVDDILPPFEGPAADDAVHAMVRLTGYLGSRLRNLELNPRSLPPDMSDVVFAAKVALVLDGEEIHSDRLFMPNLSKGFSRETFVATNVAPELARLQSSGGAHRAVVRITDDPDLALTDFRAKRRWKGTVEIPLSELLAPVPPK